MLTNFNQRLEICVPLKKNQTVDFYPNDTSGTEIAFNMPARRENDLYTLVDSTMIRISDLQPRRRVNSTKKEIQVNIPLPKKFTDWFDINNPDARSSVYNPPLMNPTWVL